MVIGLWGLYEASAEGLSFGVDLKEPEETVSEGGDHVGLELMQGQGHTFFLGHDEL